MPVPPVPDATHEDSISRPAPDVATSSVSDTAPISEVVANVEQQMPSSATPTHPPPAGAGTDLLPDYALKYAPIVYLDEKERYFPGLPSAHVAYTMPFKFSGEAVEVPEEHKGKLSMLTLEEVNKPDVFLTMGDVREESGQAEELKSVSGKPDANGRSESAVWIVVRNKTGACEWEGEIVDVFYFFFYPYNLGNTVVFKHFGNHVGDWEHAMIRFRDGKPEAMHLSAHSDGDAWKWDVFEKKGDRPVIYSASGSHAMYPRKGTHDYSGVFLVGPSDHTSAGYLWDSALNFVVARSHDTQSESVDDGPCSRYTYMTSIDPGFNTSFTPEDIVAVLSYKGRWGNSFSDLKRRGGKTAIALNAISQLETKATSIATSLFNKIHRNNSSSSEDEHTLHKAEEAIINGEGPKAAAELQAETTQKGKGVTIVSPYTQLLVLIWAEGPTGPRDKSLERRGMNRWKEGILEKC